MLLGISRFFLGVGVKGGPTRISQFRGVSKKAYPTGAIIVLCLKGRLFPSLKARARAGN